MRIYHSLGNFHHLLENIMQMMRKVPSQLETGCPFHLGLAVTLTLSKDTKVIQGHSACSRTRQKKKTFHNQIWIETSWNTVQKRMTKHPLIVANVTALKNSLYRYRDIGIYRVGETWASFFSDKIFWSVY